MRSVRVHADVNTERRERDEFCGLNAIAYWKKQAGTQTDFLSGDVRIFAMLPVHVWERRIDHGESTLHI